MAAYSNYQFASSPPPPSSSQPPQQNWQSQSFAGPPPQQHPQQQGWQSQSLAGPPPLAHHQQPYNTQQQQYNQPPQQQSFDRGPPNRSRSFDPAQSPFASSTTGSTAGTAMTSSIVSFDPYASAKSAAAGAPPAGAPPAQPGYSNYSLASPAHNNNNNNSNSPYGAHQSQAPYQSPPSYFTGEMTTSPHSQFGFAQPPPPQQQQQQQNWNSGGASVVSDVTLFTNQPSPYAAAQAPPVPNSVNAAKAALAEMDMALAVQVAAGKENPTVDLMGGMGDTSESSLDPALIAEQEKIWQDIQDRRNMELVRADGGAPPQRAMIPHHGGQMSRQPPPRTRSMPHPNMMAKPKSAVHSLAHGGVAVLDPKKDKRKQTRKVKTATGAVGGAVVGGLILGPVGVVLGAGAGSAVSNKVAKSRDKRKQAQFEQQNFQAGADSSVARKGDGSFA